jgi:outer membrane protein assembly factor BamB
MRSLFCLSLLVVALLLVGSATVGRPPSGGWTQWGGPNQNFVAASEGLAESWPEQGPRKLWTRELGEGYSAILVDGGRLYTMYRDGDQEAVVALDAKTGKTVWAHKYDSMPAEGHIHRFGDGPRSTPLILGDRIYAIGVSGRFHCLNKKDGSVVWSHDLWDEFDGNFLNHGYSSSPVAYKNTVITLVGGEEQSLVAFDKKTGDVAWKKHSFKNSYSSPKVFDVGGRDEIIVFMATELIGIDPNNGDLRWQYPIENQWEQNISMPVMVDGILFLSSSQVGARGLKLTPEGKKTAVEEVWSTRKIQFYHVNTVQVGDYVYGSTGNGPAFMAAVNVKTGEIAWRKRGFAKANCVYADGKLIILDEDGTLYLTSASPEDLTVHSQVELLDRVSWTVPTLVGKTLYVRDKATILALDLGQGG